MRFQYYLFHLWDKINVMDNWIKVEDELPPSRNINGISNNVLIVAEHSNELRLQYIDLARYDHNSKKWHNEYVVSDVTHWMPLPELPNP